MDCLRAQEILSQALDREIVDQTVLAAAREHCRTCPECVAFAHGLALLERALTPEPDAALAERVVAAVRAEAASVVTETAPAADESPAAEASPTRTALPAQDALAAGKERRRAELWRVGAWVGVAAAVILVAGFAAVGGVRFILAPTADTRDSASLAKSESGGDRVAGGAAATAPEALTDSAAETTSAYSGVASPSEARFIAVDGVAYRYIGIADVVRSSLTTAGSTTTSLDTGKVAQSYAVYATSTAGRVAVLSAAGTRVFELVRRQFDGRTYVLTAENLASFGEWPGLPAGFTAPTTSDGAPTFVKTTTDDLGVQAYVKPGTPIEDGFAIAPGTSPADPALGNPNWTWWAKPQ